MFSTQSFQYLVNHNSFQSLFHIGKFIADSLVKSGENQASESFIKKA